MPAGCIVNGTAVQKNDWSAHCDTIAARPWVDSG